MRFDALASYTPSAIRRRSTRVRVSHEGITNIEGVGNADVFVTSSKGTRYLTWVCINEDTDAIVSCACPFFLYNLEVALVRNDAGVMLYSNGDPPVVRNPMEQPYLCKHLFRVWMGRKQYGIEYHPDVEEEPEEEVWEQEPEEIEEAEPEVESEEDLEEAPENEEADT